MIAKESSTSHTEGHVCIKGTLGAQCSRDRVARSLIGQFPNAHAMTYLIVHWRFLTDCRLVETETVVENTGKAFL